MLILSRIMIEIHHFLATTFYIYPNDTIKKETRKSFQLIEIDNIYQELWKFTRFKSFFRFFFIFHSTSRQIFFLVAFSFSPLFSLFYTTVHFPIDINYFTDRTKFNISTFVSTSENTNSNTSFVDKFKYVLLKKIRFGFYVFEKKMFLYPVRRNLSKLYKLITITISGIDVDVRIEVIRS